MPNRSSNRANHANDSKSRKQVGVKKLKKKSSRLEYIDLIRGLVIVLMVLDHTRDFFFGFKPDPTDLNITTPVLFFTRWVTHFCAPVFVFLAGMSVYLYRLRRDISTTKRFLWQRGLILILLELTVIRLTWTPGQFYQFTVLQVIFAIGFAMAFSALLVGLPNKVLLLGSVAIIAGRDWLQPFELTSALSYVANILLFKDTYQLTEGVKVMVGYPVVPWLGVFIFGFSVSAYLYNKNILNVGRTYKLGLGLLALFVVLRSFNLYGDISPWATRDTWIFFVMSFLNVSKYPPSLLYISVTLGAMLTGMAFLATRPKLMEYKLVQQIVRFGQVPLFVYVAHLYLLRYPANTAQWMMTGRFVGLRQPLWLTYIVWAIVLILLIKPASWYAKQKKEKSWLRFF